MGKIIKRYFLGKNIIYIKESEYPFIVQKHRTNSKCIPGWTFVDVMAKVSLGNDLWTLSTILLQA